MPQYDDIENPEEEKITESKGGCFERKGSKLVSKKMNLWSLMDVMEQWQNQKR